MMKVHGKNMFFSFAITGLLFLLAQEIQASEFGAYSYSASANLAQHSEDWKQFELTAGQARSRVKKRLVNYLLGKTVNKYLEFGVVDNTGRKNIGRLKLRLNSHRAMFVYRYTFY